MTSEPVISVLMSVHNGQDFLGEAVDSVLSQTFADFEFLIVDDGSTDGTGAILDGYVEQDSRIRVLSQAQQGLTKSLNAGLRAAKGSFVARFDADDISLPERFQHQLAAFHANDALVLLGCEVELISDTGLHLGLRGHATEHDEIRRQLLLGRGGALSHPAVMIRRSAIDAVGGYDETYPVAQDLDFFLKLSEIGQVGNLPEVLLLWRQHGSSINRTRAHLWASLKRRAIESTINRVGAAEYARALFYDEQQMPSVGDAFELGVRAEAGGRYRTAFRLYAQSMKDHARRSAAIKGLMRVTARYLVRWPRQRGVSVRK